MIYDVLTPFPLRELESRNGAAYIDKMMHQVPNASVVDRERFILAHCEGKRVLNLGCASGALHGQIKAVALRVIGVDRNQPSDMQMDFDALPYQGSGEWPQYDLIVAGEVIEHLTNPGNFLKWLKGANCPLLLTVPNAFARAAHEWMSDGFEQVNPDHVCWYSWRTMKTLLEKTGFEIQEFHWYHGKPLTAEGLIFLTK